jgi:hypothetical protein
MPNGGNRLELFATTGGSADSTPAADCNGNAAAKSREEPDDKGRSSRRVAAKDTRVDPRIGRELGVDNERTAYAALRATMHAVRDRLRLEPGQIEHILAALPEEARRLWRHAQHEPAVR